jgi:hypothetical protein
MDLACATSTTKAAERAGVRPIKIPEAAKVTLKRRFGKLIAFPHRELHHIGTE